MQGLHNQHLLDKHKVPYAQLNGRMRPLIYDRDGNFYYIEESGAVLDSQKQPTPYHLGSGFGDLYKGDEYVGNIYLNGAVGKNEAGAVTTFGAPLKAPSVAMYLCCAAATEAKPGVIRWILPIWCFMKRTAPSWA